MDETLFRIVFLILWLIFFTNLIWVRYSSRNTTSKHLADDSTRHEKQWHIIALAIFAPLWFAGIILYVLIPRWITFFSMFLPAWFRLIMACVATLSIPFTIWGYRALGKNWVHALEPSQFQLRNKGTLVTTGPYRYVRNPIYLGAFTFFIALGLVASNGFLLVPDVFVITIVYLQIDGEEKMLAARFGDEYLGYMKRTPRLIPMFRH